VAGSFAVLGGSTVTNTGPSLVTGDLGVWPGTSITGILPEMVIGTIHTTDAVAQGAQNDVTTAYNDLAGQACNFNLTDQDLGGRTLIPGVYCFDTSAQLTGTLTLNAQGDPNAVWVFQMGSTLTTASASSVTFINGGAGDPGCNVFWQVGSSATLGTTTDFVGNILALESITMNTGANLYGSTLARNAAVTLDSNTITKSSCAPIQNNSLVLAKSLTGGPTGYTGPFTIHWDCGVFGSGDKSVFAGGSATVPNIPSGTSCTVSEPTLPNVPDYTFGTPTFSPPSATVTIPAGSGSSITVTTNNTLTRDLGSLKISKTVSNPDGASLPATFTGTYNCGNGYTGNFSVAAGAPQTISGIPTGSTCSVVETAPATIPNYTWGTITYTPATIDIANTTGTFEIVVGNSITRNIDRGSFKITKHVTNPDGATLPGAFTGTYDCGTGYTGNFSVAAGDSQIISGIPTGNICSVVETAPAPITGFTWGTTTYTPATIVIANTTGNFEIVVGNSITRDVVPSPALSLVKTAAPATYDHVGQTISYSYVVKNTGNVTLAGPVTVADDKATVTCPAGGLVPGASMTCTASYTIKQSDLDSGSVKNTAKASANGTDSNGAAVTVMADQKPKIDVEKSVKNGAGVWQDADTIKGPYLNPGVNPQFKFVVTNTGNVTLTGITLVDNIYNLSGCTIPATLAPNASFECLVTGTWAAGQHTNTASAKGTFNTVKYTDTDNANYFGVVPLVSKTANGTYQEVHDWQVIKSVDVSSQNAYAGQKVDFTWTVHVAETTRSENRLVTGVITVVNPNPDAPMSMSLNDTLNDGSVATIGPCTGGTWNSTTKTLTVPKGSTATCNYSAMPTGEADLAALEAALPDSATINVHRGVNSYFDSTISNGGILDGTHEGWCVDGRRGIMEDQDYTANVFSSYETLPAGVFDHPENFDLVNWIINQHFVGKSAGGSLGDYTRNDVQKAIWDLLQDNITTSLSYDAARVTQIKAAAASHNGFKPTCGDLVAVILQPVAGKQVSIIQVPVDCAKRNTVTAVHNGFEFKASADIHWTATPVNPTAKLDDDQNPAWPTTISEAASFTYEDSYTCPAKSSTRSWNPTTYTESNTAVLTFSTGSVSSTASTTVKCEEYVPALTLVKTASPTTYSKLGDVINYSYLVKNTGNVSLAGPLSVTDDKTTVTCPTGSLAINATMTCSAKYKITQADINYSTVENTAFASANGTNSNTDAKTVELVKDPQTITVTKHAPGSAANKTSFSVAATGGASGNPIVYSASGACTNIGAVFTMTSSTGTCIVHYNQAGNAGYEAAPEVTEVVNATKAFWRIYLPLVIR
jgi:uncharacterized repeat protein (TIGR01451 family)